MRKKAVHQSLVINLAAHKVPVFKEDWKRGEYKWIAYGADMEDQYWYNRYPDYLLQLFNRSAKHGAIVSGKAKYINGAGFDTEIKNIDEKVLAKILLWFKQVNPKYDIDELKKRISLDLEIFGGFYFKIIPNKKKTGIASIYHVDWSYFRFNEDLSKFYYCKTWNPNEVANPQKDDSFKEYPAFEEGNYKQTSIFCYREYRPGLKTYPLPEYISGCADIESSVEISNYDLNNIKNGFWGGKHISYNNGVPPEEIQAAVEKKLKEKFTGTDKAGTMVVSFSDSKDNAPTVDDITQTNSDKVFDATEPRVSEGIFVAHKVTSPMLFGIKTEGQLGGRDELIQAWTLFQANYVTPKQREIEKVFNYFANLMGLPEVLKIVPLDFPITWSENTMASVMNINEIRQSVGLKSDMNEREDNLYSTIVGMNPKISALIMDSLTKDEIRSLAGLNPLPVEVAPIVDENGIIVPQKSTQQIEQSKINDNIKNLTGKQFQHLQRIGRQYAQGKLTKEAAVTLLKSSFGLSDEDINSFLGIEENDDVEMMKFYQVQNNRLLEQFANCGIPRSKVSLIARRFKFEEQEANFYGADVLTKTEAKVLSIINNDKMFDIDNTASLLKISVEDVFDIVAGLKDSGYVKESTTKNKPKTYTITNKGTDIINTAPKSVSIKTVYSYQVRPNMGETLIEGSRDFCRKLVSLDRVYSRADIQTISAREGYDVFEFTGGWYTKPGGKRGEDTTPFCRHKWAKELVYVNND